MVIPTGIQFREISELKVINIVIRPKNAAEKVMSAKARIVPQPFLQLRLGDVGEDHRG